MVNNGSAGSFRTLSSDLILEFTISDKKLFKLIVFKRNFL